MELFGTPRTDVQHFTRRIDHSEQRQYLRVPFTVHPHVDTLTIEYGYTRHRMLEAGAGITLRNEVNIVDLALEDPTLTLVGASGSEKRQVVLHANHATPGYRPGDIVPGQWQLVLGAYLIEAEGCPVEITIRQTFKTPCLLVGDCHVHTEHSDGWYPVEALLDRARQDKLDFIFVTDHNCMTSNALLRSDPTLTVLPGVEMTYYDGHYNLFGLPRPVATNTANGRDEVLAIMREGKKNGALASLNHPTCNNCGWKYGFDADVPADLIEIWNGPFTPQNAAAVQLWHEHLCRGRRWPAIGGSDCHHAELFRIVATPATFLYAASNAPQDILDAMAGGHAFVGMQPNAPRIHMAMGDARMGEVCAQSGQALQLTLGGLSDGDEVRLIDATGVVWRQAPGRCHRYEAAYGGPASKFLRVEIWRELPGIGKTLASIGNPIYMA